MIFYEAPHRIEKTLQLCLQVFGDRKAVLARELTKLHETFHRGTLSKLCELKDLKGEMVLIIEGYRKQEEDIDISKLIKEVDKLVKQGVKAKTAMSGL